jgi:hypothetical protein
MLAENLEMEYERINKILIFNTNKWKFDTLNYIIIYSQRVSLSFVPSFVYYWSNFCVADVNLQVSWLLINVV